MPKPSISAVVVTYKTKDLLAECLKSLFDEATRSELPIDLVVVDNASHDGTVEMVREKFPQARLVANTGNFGPARAFNQGIAKAITASEYILVLNSDIKVLPNTLRAMVDYLEENPDVHGVSGPLLNEDGTRQMIKTHIWNLRKPDWRQRFRVEFVGTTFALIRSGVFQTVGGYDENYFFYNEDLDWAERAKKANRLFMYLPEAPVIHYQSKGKNQNLSRITRELFWSNIYYFKKFYPRFSWAAYWLMRLDLDHRSRSLRRRLKKTTDHEERRRAEESLADYQEARKRLIQEYKTDRSPRVPFWKEEP